jgi:hypothetical protein
LPSNHDSGRSVTACHPCDGPQYRGIFVLTFTVILHRASSLAFLRAHPKAMRIRENDVRDSAHLSLGARKCAALDLPGMLEDEKDVGREGVVVDSRSLSRSRPSRLLAGSALSSDSAVENEVVQRWAPASNRPGCLDRKTSKLLLSFQFMVSWVCHDKSGKGSYPVSEIRFIVIGCTSPIPMRDNVAARTAQEKFGIQVPR